MGSEMCIRDSIAPSGYESYPPQKDSLSEEIVFPAVPAESFREGIPDGVKRSDENHPVRAFDGADM